MQADVILFFGHTRLIFHRKIRSRSPRPESSRTSAQTTFFLSSFFNSVVSCNMQLLSLGQSRQKTLPYPASCFCRTCQWWRRCEAAFRASFCLCTCQQSPLSRWAGSCRGWWRRRRDPSMSAKRLSEEWGLGIWFMRAQVMTSSEYVCDKNCSPKFSWNRPRLSVPLCHLGPSLLRKMTDHGTVKLGRLIRLG